MMMGACQKCLHAAYERNRRPPEKLYQPWIDDCIAQVKNALVAVDAMIDPKKPYLLFERLTQADVTAVVAERLARVVGSDTDVRGPLLAPNGQGDGVARSALGGKAENICTFPQPWRVGMRI
jgi:glutathione S-transferase